MNRQRKWDGRYLELARLISTWSKDPSTQVGAVLVSPDNRIIATGYNGFPPGHDDSPELYADRVYKYQHVVHAEANALIFARETANRATLYTSFPCCPTCMTRAARAGVRRIVQPPLNTQGKDQNWIEEWRLRLLEAGEVAAQHRIEIKTHV